MWEELVHTACNTDQKKKKKETYFQNFFFRAVKNVESFISDISFALVVLKVAFVLSEFLH